MLVTPPPVHVPRPYALPTVPLVARVECPMPDGATIVAWTYAPEGVTDAPGTPFGIDLCVPPVLMLHGNGEEHGIFGPVIDAVCASGRSVIAVDSRSQGASTRGTAPLTYELMADDAIEVCARLGVPQVHVLGFSDGGILGLLLARDWGAHVLSLTALGANLTPAGLPKEDTDWMAFAAAENRRWAKEGHEGAELEDGTPVPSPAESARIAELLQLMVENPQIDAASLAGIDCPVTVMVGEFDEILPEETGRIVAAIPGAVKVVEPGIDHNLPKMAPAAVARELFACVARNDECHEVRAVEPPADLAFCRIPVSGLWAEKLDELYRRVDAEPGTSGWVQDVWPPVGMARELLAAGAYWGAFEASSVRNGMPADDAALLGAVAVNHDAAMGNGRAPGHGSGLGGPGWRRHAKRDVAGWHLLAVDPAARGRHVADALIAAGTLAARELGAKVVRLNTNVANVPANALYASRGLTRHRPIWLPYPGLPLPGWSNLWELEL
ncbi:alpha/beta fold hydrolase [Thermophilibacter sp. ET337]|uniref:bifunctional alpha/beta hydrolase/GNAT family N-acetyltransferase n=1 Tax=Thermophilibacter sp. ET337 TaxID=2973084 RepID=UPI0021AC50CF|nr:bifunctional alpha/beta hydrolase/GNAT family N-acetyltransferase [Thermophilibacter sp. ET337]MCR8907422.1 alpha/beta fold hydrolase [Thermophilibacter sp. ET337]